MLRLLSVVLVAALAGCASRPADRPLSERVDALMAPLVAANEFSGAVVLMRSGEVVYQRGFGMANRAAGVAFTPETPSDGGSLAKTFTAAGIAWLAQAGRVDLDAPVTRYVPEYPHAATTVRQLVSHTNGLPPYYEFFDNHFKSEQVRTTAAMLAIVAREAPAPSFPPGSRFEYSNFAFDVAALLIERVTGEDFVAFVNAQFFARLDMTGSFARPGRFADWRGVRTMGYQWQDGGWKIVDVYDMEAFLGASNFYFPAIDLARWAAAYAAGNALPPDVAAAGARRPVIAGQSSGINSLSWYCDEPDTRCYYTGSLNAFHGFVYWDRKRNEAVVFVSNSSLPPWSTVTLERALVSALAGDTMRAEAPVAFETFRKDTRSAVAGTYAVEGLGTVTISHSANALRWRVGTGLEFDVFQVSGDVFYVPGPDYWLAFSGGARPSTLHLRSVFKDARGPRQ